MPAIEVLESVKCFHCGDTCNDVIPFDEKTFCCEGCRTVYDILHSSNLCEYYNLDQNSGQSQRNIVTGSFEYLDSKDIRKKLLVFDSPELAKIEFTIPAIHCVSCIWLLENLRKINPGIIKAEVTFGKKTVGIDFNPSQVKLSEVAELLTTLGYSPIISLEDINEKQKKRRNPLLFKLAVAGFCFGNIMLFSFPEYLGLDARDETLHALFSWLNLGLAIPVFFYSASTYLVSAFNSFRQKQINIDVSITAGLVALFFRSGYDIITHTGPGYLDSFAGLVFFLLIGRWFQERTYENLSFDRDFKSYFPLAVNVLDGKEWKTTIIHELKKGDIIKVRNMDIVAADSILNEAHAYFDYSFITGEARPVKLAKNELVYAGARLIGQPVIMIVDRMTSASHLTSLWNREDFRKGNEKQYQKTIDRAARKFTWIVLALAVGTGIFWFYKSPADMWMVVTAVLMVACPCALALAAPFTYGTMLRVFGQHDFYLKNADVIERLSVIDAVVFDKTGTITHGHKPEIELIADLNSEEMRAIRLLTSASNHPLSKLISESIEVPLKGDMDLFREIPGKGLEAMIGGRFYKAGSPEFLGVRAQTSKDRSYVFISIDDQLKGYFTVKVKTRPHVRQMIERLGNRLIALVSGDNDSGKSSMLDLFPSGSELRFNQTPLDKMNYIRQLQGEHRKVMMVGDGLNDSGALQQSDVGIAVCDDTGIFTPASDGILKGDRLEDLDRFISLARSSATILKWGFGISFFYNAIALSVAMTGYLTPLTAAILMPISSISVVTFSSVAVNLVARKKLSPLKK